MAGIKRGFPMKITLPLLLIAFTLSFYIRAILPYDSVFTPSFVAFAADDAVYHMRLVENLIANFPHRIWFEPFTLYPTGATLHFGPLWTYMIATTSIIIGLGSPSIELTRTIGAFFPAIFGALTVFPVYVIGKEVFNKHVGLFAAFLVAVMPGQILTRSLLGFTDHHIGEVFFSTLFLMFFIMAIKASHDLSISHVRRYPLYPATIYSVLAGISFSLYMLQWSSGVFFGGIVAIFITVHYIMLHLQNKSLEGTCIVSSITFASALPLLLPFITTNNAFAVIRYSYLHILITVGASFLFIFLYLLSTRLDKTTLPKFYYPLTIFFLSLFAITFAKLYVPSAFSSFMSFFTIFNPNVGGATTIAEASQPTPQMIFANYPGAYNFLSTYYFAILSIAILAASLLFKWKPEKALFVIWCIIIFALTTGQNRWFYYYSVNVAILSSFFVFSLIKYTNIHSTIKRIKEEVTDSATLHTFLTTKPKHIIPIAISILIIFTVFAPNFTASTSIASHGTVSPDYHQWHESLTWMRNNTPDPGLDFNAVYPLPPVGETFQYPSTAYGVMSWWDYGHVITYFAHRIPNTNPFQTGIGGGEFHLPGASTFFTAQSEASATSILNSTQSRYIVSSAYMAYSIQEVMAIWNLEDTSLYQTPIVVSGTPQYAPTLHYFSTMESKLHIFDTSGLTQYRLIHESEPNPNTIGGSQELRTKYLYNFIHQKPLPVVQTGYIKIFEHVPGATIKASTPLLDDTPILIYLNITTNQNRSIDYLQHSTVQNNTFTFTVPYSTTGLLPNGTQFDTLPTGPYIIACAKYQYPIHISETDIMSGTTIHITFPGAHQ